MAARGIALAFLLAGASGDSAWPDTVAMEGRSSNQPEAILRTADAVALCLRREREWIDFCNGLVQAYAEHAILRGAACIPFGVSRRDLVDVFTGPDVVVSTGYVDNLPAIETAVEMFVRHFPCK